MNAHDWFILFTTAGLVLFVMEVFLPGWVAGTAAAICMVAAAVSAFPAFGFKGGMLACILLMGGALAFVALWVRILPGTTVGKTIILRQTMDPEKVQAECTALLGKPGVAVTRLAPAGIVQVDGRRVDVVSDGTFVEPGEAIRVVKVTGRHVTVRKATD